MRYFDPPRGGGWYGANSPWKGGPRAPRPPKMGILGSFWPIWGHFRAIRSQFDPQRPPKSDFYPNFEKKDGYPPGKLKKSKKRSRFRPEIFQNFRKVMEKPPHFQESWGFWGLWPPKGPFWPPIAHFRLSIPSTTSFLWPLLCNRLFCWWEQWKGLQRIRPSKGLLYWSQISIQRSRFCLVNTLNHQLSLALAM